MTSPKLYCYMLSLCTYLVQGQFDSGMSGKRRVVAQLFEWPFTDIKEECKNVLGPQEFGAVLVSPVTENVVIEHKLKGKIVRPWFERYQPISWNIISRSGTEEEFQEMVAECNKNDVRVYVDIVLNHAVYGEAGQPSGNVIGVGGSVANVKRKEYPGLGFDERNFHESCFLDGTNRTAVRICELWGLHDVNQTQPYVQDKIVTLMNKLINYGVAGFRIDAAKHMWPADLIRIYKQLKDVSLNGGKTLMRPFWALEIVDDGSYQEDYRNIGSEYDFTFSGMAASAFRWGSVKLSSIYEYAQEPTYRSKTVQDLSVNQDSQREVWQDGYWSSRDRKGIQQVINAFILSFSRNTPNIFSGFGFKDKDEGPPSDDSGRIISPGQCKAGWMCEHRDKHLQWIIKYFTNVVGDSPVEEWWSGDSDGANQAAFQRGKTGFAVFNADTRKLNQSFQVSLPPGTYCDLATGYLCPARRKCVGWLKRQVEVEEDGSVSMSLPGMLRSGQAQEPPYLVISIMSMHPPTGNTEVEVETLPIKEVIVCILLVVLTSTVTAGLVRFFFCSKSKDAKCHTVRNDVEA